MLRGGRWGAFHNSDYDHGTVTHFSEVLPGERSAAYNREV